MFAPRSDARAFRAVSSALRTSVYSIPMALGIAGAASGTASAASATFTANQAAQGGAVFAANCATCHAANLAGGAGPALVGKAFHASLDANYKDGFELYDFIAKQMPLNAPGSLSQANFSL